MILMWVKMVDVGKNGGKKAWKELIKSFHFKISIGNAFKILSISRLNI